MWESTHRWLHVSVLNLISGNTLQICKWKMLKLIIFCVCTREGKKYCCYLNCSKPNSDLDMKKNCLTKWIVNHLPEEFKESASLETFKNR